MSDPFGCASVKNLRWIAGESSAEHAIRRGWLVGTELVGDAGQGLTTITITAIGKENILAVGSIRGTETVWELNDRNWTIVRDDHTEGAMHTEGAIEDVVSPLEGVHVTRILDIARSIMTAKRYLRRAIDAVPGLRPRMSGGGFVAELKRMCRILDRQIRDLSGFQYIVSNDPALPRTFPQTPSHTETSLVAGQGLLTLKQLGLLGWSATPESEEGVRYSDILRATPCLPEPEVAMVADGKWEREVKRALKKHCPYCGAKAGDVCRTISGAYRGSPTGGPHRARSEDA